MVFKVEVVALRRGYRQSLLLKFGIKAYKEDKLQTPNLELAFISKGFNNWKDDVVKFKEHESSNCHKDSVVVTFDLPSSVKDIAETLESELTKQKMEN